jgi:alpha-tubulin suppressor-like RCC1 family protein
MTPARVEGLRGHRTVALACGQYHTAAVTAAGALLTCGKNDWGQLGFPAAVPASGTTVAGMYIPYTFVYIHSLYCNTGLSTGSF